MRSVFTWSMRILLMFVLAILAVGAWKWNDIQRLIAVNTLFEPERIVQNFSTMQKSFLHVPLRTESPVVPFATAPRMTLPDGVADWMATRRVTSVVVLKDGALVYEDYFLGTGPQDLRIGWSLSKSYLSALTGLLVGNGQIGLDDRVIDFVPTLRDSAYHRATVRHVLNMATGVTFDEDYLDYNSDINRMGRVLALGGKMDAFAAALTETFAPPGTEWRYVSIDTHVLGMVVRGATGRSLPDLMGERIIAPLGVERAPIYLVDGSGVAFALGGLNSTTRDFARFGQMIAQGGFWNGHQIVPRDWVLTSTTASAPTAPGAYGYGFQWWMPPAARPREYMGRGIYGQYLYINETAGVVIVLTAADPDFREARVLQENIDVFRQITDSF